MYNFIDTTETLEGKSLPSEALKINGEYIENLIEGYRTLTVEGREALSPEISTYETGIRDGSTMQGKRYPARTIRITYQLIAASNEEFRAAYNKLASILDVKDAELIFDDEPDKFFTGTPSYIGEVEPGRNAVVGEFEILCLDPFKYSVMEHEAGAAPGEPSILIDYGGTYKGYPTLQAEFFKEDEASEDGETVTELTGSGDCGYVAFFNEDEKIIQIGDPDEVDTEDGFDPSQTLVNQSFQYASSWGSAAKANWKVNSGITAESNGTHSGNVGMAVADWTTPDNSTTKTTKLLSIDAEAEAPYIHYDITATARRFEATGVDVEICIAANLKTDSNYFGIGYILKATVSIGENSKTVYLKDINQRWEGREIHKTYVSFTVRAAEDVTSIEDVKFQTTRPDKLGSTGLISETECAAISIPAYIAPEPERYYLTATNYGTGSKWHGASITRTLPADAAGEVGATNCTLTFSHKMSISSGGTAQHGAFQALLVSGSGTDRKIVAGVYIYKGSAGKSASLRFLVNGAKKETLTIDLSYNNAKFNGKTATITKSSGGTVIFSIGGYVKSYTDSALADVAVTEVTFKFSQSGSKAPLGYNGLYWAKFVKNKCATWKDIPNKFSANDMLEADCKTGQIFLNGIATPALGALGNDWEDFTLTPGINQIGFSYSEWVEADYAPTFKVKYREVFL